RPDDPSANESAVAAHVERWVRAQGFDVEVQDVAPGRPNVLASLGDRAAGPTLLLEGHTDVVTEGDPAAWTHPPFGAALADRELCLEQRGVVWARVTARGRMAHGAMPEAGANPITALAALIADAPRLERRLRALCARSRYLRPPTVTPTVIAAPVAGVPQSNVIPAAAQATLDVRLTPGPDAGTVTQAIDAAWRRAADAGPGRRV